MDVVALLGELGDLLLLVLVLVAAPAAHRVLLGAVEAALALLHKSVAGLGDVNLLDPLVDEFLNRETLIERRREAGEGLLEAGGDDEPLALAAERVADLGPDRELVGLVAEPLEHIVEDDNVGGLQLLEALGGEHISVDDGHASLVAAVGLQQPALEVAEGRVQLNAHNVLNRGVGVVEGGEDDAQAAADVDNPLDAMCVRAAVLAAGDGLQMRGQEACNVQQLVAAEAVRDELRRRRLSGLALEAIVAAHDAPLAERLDVVVVGVQKVVDFKRRNGRVESLRLRGGDEALRGGQGAVGDPILQLLPHRVELVAEGNNIVGALGGDVVRRGARHVIVIGRGRSIVAAAGTSGGGALSVSDFDLRLEVGHVSLEQHACLPDSGSGEGGGGLGAPLLLLALLLALLLVALKDAAEAAEHLLPEARLGLCDGLAFAVAAAVVAVVMVARCVAALVAGPLGHVLEEKKKKETRKVGNVQIYVLRA